MCVPNRTAWRAKRFGDSKKAEWTRHEQAEEREIKRIIGKTPKEDSTQPWREKVAVILGGYLPNGVDADRGVTLVAALTDKSSTTIDELSRTCGSEPAHKEQMEMLEQLAGESFGPLTKERARAAIREMLAKQEREERGVESFSRACFLAQKRTAREMNRLKLCIPTVEADMNRKRRELAKLKREFTDAADKELKHVVRVKRDLAYCALTAFENIVDHLREQLREAADAQKNAIRDRILFWQCACGKNAEGENFNWGAVAEYEEYRERYPAKVPTQAEVAAILAALDEQEPNWEVTCGAGGFFGALALNLPEKVRARRR